MRFAHTNIVAKDWKRLAQFYVDVFECRIKPPERDLSGPWLDRATGLENAQLTGVHLRLPGYDETGPTLEIFSYKDMIGRPETVANHAGLCHIAFEVDHVGSVLDRALDHGATLLGKPTQKEFKDVGILTFLYLRDPEGNIIEIQSWE